MVRQDAGLSSEFVARQQERLLQMQQEILHGDTDVRANEHRPNEGQAEFDRLRIGDIQRALQKIDEGTYGLSDESGQPIPQSRLEAIPDALYTEREEEEREVGK
jgi:DnaK suppressor protein